MGCECALGWGRGKGARNSFLAGFTLLGWWWLLLLLILLFFPRKELETALLLLLLLQEGKNVSVK